MLTIRTSAHVPANRHRRNYRSCPVCTGAALARLGGLRSLPEWIRLWDAERRRLWLQARWRLHRGRIESAQMRRRP